MGSPIPMGDLFNFSKRKKHINPMNSLFSHLFFIKCFFGEKIFTRLRFLCVIIAISVLTPFFSEPFSFFTMQVRDEFHHSYLMPVESFDTENMTSSIITIRHGEAFQHTKFFQEAFCKLYSGIVESIFPVSAYGESVSNESAYRATNNAEDESNEDILHIVIGSLLGNLFVALAVWIYTQRKIHPPGTKQSSRKGRFNKKVAILKKTARVPGRECNGLLALFFHWLFTNLENDYMYIKKVI